MGERPSENSGEWICSRVLPERLRETPAHLHSMSQYHLLRNPATVYLAFSARH